MSNKQEKINIQRIELPSVENGKKCLKCGSEEITWLLSSENELKTYLCLKCGENWSEQK